MVIVKKEEDLKMSRKKEYYLIVDTETANSVQQPLPYDIGYAICDREGNIQLKRSFIVAETFLDYPELMQTAYYAEKIPQYWKDIQEGTRIIRTAYNIKTQMRADMKKFNVKKVGAYNMSFDKKALNNLTRYLTKSKHRYWFPFGIQYFCIWSMATQTILQQKTFFKMAEKNGWISECGNLKTNAEVTYSYITKQIDFEESHTGLEDVEIEVQIFAHCIRQHKALKWDVNPNCWRIPTKIYKANKK